MVSEFLNSRRTFFKDIVQPKKEGVKNGSNRFVSTWYTIADIL
jgi:hypothetical protein